MLRELEKELKGSYSSIEDNVSEAFYNLVLKESISYKRISGYFSSKALSIYADGLDKICENDGYIQFIISQNISEEDFNEIQKGYYERSRSEILTQVDKYRLGNLAYLISIGRVDIKFGLVRNGLFHTKWGIFEDSSGDMIYFNGSLNETANAIENNYDSFDVDFSWDISENVSKRVKQKKEEFTKLWNNNYSEVKVIEATEVVYEFLKEFNVGKIQNIYEISDNSVIFDMNDESFFFRDKSNEQIYLIYWRLRVSLFS